MIVCNVAGCPYKSKEGKFCLKKIVDITDRALCGQLYDKYGQVKQNWHVLDENLKKQER